MARYSKKRRFNKRRGKKRRRMTANKVYTKRIGNRF